MKTKKILMYIAIFLVVYVVLLSSIVGGFYLFRSKPEEPDVPKDTTGTPDAPDADSDTEGGETTESDPSVSPVPLPSFPVTPVYPDDTTENSSDKDDVLMPDSEPLIPSEGLEFVSYSYDGSAIVAGMGSCRDSHVIIPSVSPKGEPVKRIEEFSFSSVHYLESVVVPHGVLYLDMKAFAGSVKLQSVTLPSSIVSLQSPDIFYGCESLTEVHYGGTVQEWTRLVLNRRWPIDFTVYCTDGEIIYTDSR